MTHCHCSARSVLLEQLRNPSILEIRISSHLFVIALQCSDFKFGQKMQRSGVSHLRGFFTDLAPLRANARPEEIPWKRIKVRSSDDALQFARRLPLPLLS